MPTREIIKLHDSDDIEVTITHMAIILSQGNNEIVIDLGDDWPNLLNALGLLKG